MAESYTSICNQALGRVGEYDDIQLEGDSSKEANVCRKNYLPVRDWCLRQGVWGFAKKRVILAPSATSPAYGYRSYFPKPSDFIRLVDVNDNPYAEYEEESEGFWYDGDAMNLRYVARIDDPTRFDPAFVDFYVCRLAEVIHPSLNDSATKKQDLRRDRIEAMRTARSVGAIEIGIRTIPAEHFIVSRG